MKECRNYDYLTNSQYKTSISNNNQTNNSVNFNKTISPTLGTKNIRHYSNNKLDQKIVVETRKSLHNELNKIVLDDASNKLFN